MMTKFAKYFQKLAKNKVIGGCRVNRECITPSRSDRNNACDVCRNFFFPMTYNYRSMPTTNFLGKFLTEVPGSILAKHSRRN